MTVKLLHDVKETLKNRKLLSPVHSRKLSLKKSFTARVSHYLAISHVFRSTGSNSNDGQKEQVRIIFNVTSLFVLASSHLNLSHSLQIQTSFSTLPPLLLRMPSDLFKETAFS